MTLKTEVWGSWVGRCNNVTFGTESSQSRSHMTIIIQNLILVSMISSMTPHLVELPLEVALPSLSTHSTPYTFVFLRTHLPINSSYCYVCVPTGTTFRLGIYLRLSICQDMQFVILGCCSTWRGSWAAGWMQSMLFPYVAVSLVICIGRSN